MFGRAEAIDHLFEPEKAEALGVVETDEPVEAIATVGRA
jgi:hypothetical protein